MIPSSSFGVIHPIPIMPVPTSWLSYGLVAVGGAGCPEKRKSCGASNERKNSGPGDLDWSRWSDRPVVQVAHPNHR